MNIKEKLQTFPAITPKTGDKDTETGDNAGRRRLPLVPYKAFALSGRQACGHEYPGRMPWARSFCPFGACGANLRNFCFIIHKGT